MLERHSSSWPSAVSVVMTSAFRADGDAQAGAALRFPGEGDVAPSTQEMLTQEMLCRAEPDPDLRPHVHTGG